MSKFRFIKKTATTAIALQLSLVAPVIADPQVSANKEKAGIFESIFKKDFLDFKSMSLQWEGSSPVRVIRIPLISGKNLAATYLLGKIPFIGTSSYKNSFMQIRKVVSGAEVTRMSAADWNAEDEIDSHLKKNPFTNENALLVLEPGEEIRFEMDASKSVGLKLGAGGLVPIGGSASVGEGQRFIFAIHKLNNDQVQLDVTRMSQIIKGTKANVGPGFTFLAESDAATAKNLSFRDFYSNLYMNLIQNVQNKGVTDSYILDLNSQREVALFNDAVIKKVVKKKHGSVKSGDDLQVLEESFMDELELAAKKLDAEVRNGRSEIKSETDSLNRNAGFASLFGKFLYSSKFSRNFLRVENSNLAVLQFYQTEASLVGAKRSFWSSKDGRFSNMGLTFSTKGDYEQPEIDQLLEIEIHSTRYSYSKDNKKQIKQWRQYFMDFMPEALYSKVFSGPWSSDSRAQLVDPRLTTSVYFNRGFLMAVATQAQQDPEGAKAYFEKQLASYISNANEHKSGKLVRRNSIVEAVYQFFVDRFGRENEGFIDTKNESISKQIKEIASILAQVVDSGIQPIKRVEAFESLRKVSLFKRLSTGFLINLIYRSDISKYVTIEINRSHDEIEETAGKSIKVHQHQEYREGAVRNPNVKAIQELINRSKGAANTAHIQGGTQIKSQASVCGFVFAG